MTTEIFIEDKFDCSADKLYGLLSDDTFDDALMNALQIKKECLEKKEDASGPVYKLRLTNPEEIPAIAKKFTGEKLSYIETRAWNKTKCANTWIIAPEIKGATVEAKGKTEIVASNSGCIRKTTGSITVKIPLIGGKIEEMVKQSIIQTFKKNADFCRNYLQENT